MRFADNRVTLRKDEVPTSETIEQLFAVDLSARATPRMVASGVGSGEAFRPADGRAKRRAHRGGHLRTRRRGVALTEKPWEHTGPMHYEVTEDGAIKRDGKLVRR